MGYFEPKKVDTYLSKFSHHASFHQIWSTANWVFFCWLICHLTPMLLIVSKQGWCHFEALKLWNVSFIWTLKNFTPAISWLTINKIQRFRAYGIIAKCNQNNLDFTFKRMNVTWSHNSLKKKNQTLKLEE